MKESSIRCISSCLYVYVFRFRFLAAAVVAVPGSPAPSSHARSSPSICRQLWWAAGPAHVRCFLHAYTASYVHIGVGWLWTIPLCSYTTFPGAHRGSDFFLFYVNYASYRTVPINVLWRYTQSTTLRRPARGAIRAPRCVFWLVLGSSSWTLLWRNVDWKSTARFRSSIIRIAKSVVQ